MAARERWTARHVVLLIGYVEVALVLAVPLAREIRSGSAWARTARAMRAASRAFEESGRVPSSVQDGWGRPMRIGVAPASGTSKEPSLVLVSAGADGVFEQRDALAALRAWGGDTLHPEDDTVMADGSFIRWPGA